MKVGLFIPCYVDQFYPGAAIATLQLLEKLGVDVATPGTRHVAVNIDHVTYRVNIAYIGYVNFLSMCLFAKAALITGRYAYV